MRIPRKLKKRYKKMGIWSAYLFEGRLVGMSVKETVPGETDITEEDLIELVRSVSIV